MRRAILSVITLITTVAFAGTAMAGHHLASEQPTVGNLKWMTGSWAGDIGGPTLEENWTQAKAGSIASLVRITSPEGTAMVEIVNIQEMEGTLVLHIQQWDPGFVPRADAQNGAGEHRTPKRKLQRCKPWWSQKTGIQSDGRRPVFGSSHHRRGSRNDPASECHAAVTPKFRPESNHGYHKQRTG